MALTELLVVGLLLLTIVCCWYARSVAQRQRSNVEHLPTVSEYVRACEEWPYDLPGLQKEKQSWAPDPPDLKDPIDGRD